MTKAKFIFNREAGFNQIRIGEQDESIVEFDVDTIILNSGSTFELNGANIPYTPEDPSQWSAVPTNLVQAVDYLAAGSGSGGGGGGGGTPGGSNGDIQYKVNATTFGGVNKLTFVAGNLVGTGSFNGVFSGSLTKLTDGSDYLLAGTNITLTTGSNGSVTIDGAGSIGGTIAANEVAFGNGGDAIAGSPSFTWNEAADSALRVYNDAATTNIKMTAEPYMLIESSDSMNINVANFAGALGLQAGGVDLVLIGGDDGGGQSYLQTQPNVRLESKGRLLVQPATDGADAVEIKDSAGTYIIQVDSTTKTVSLTGDANPVLSLVDEISATPFLQITPSTREVSMSDPSIPTNTTVISTTDVAVADGVGTGNLSAQVIGVTDTGTTNKITLSSPGGEATLKADDGAGALIELHLSASSLTMQSLVASGDFFSVDASAQRLTVVDPGTGVDLVYLEGGRLTVDAAGNTLSFDAFTVPTITTLNVGSSLPMPLNLSIEALQINTDPGSAGYVLVSSGSGAAPVWVEAPYNAAVAADWNGTPPTTIKEALDRIAAALGPIA